MGLAHRPFSRRPSRPTLTLQDRDVLAQLARYALAQPWRIAIYNTTIVMLCMAH